MAAVDWPAGEPTSIAFGPGCYVLRRGNEALIGATMEYVGYESSVTRDGIDGLMQEAARLYPALAGVTPKRTWAGLRPISPDGRPFIGPDPELEGLWYATGHGRNGVVLAGITGEIIAALYAGQPVEHDLKDVAPARFWRYGHHLK
jgi:glycine oxidase